MEQTRQQHYWFKQKKDQLSFGKYSMLPVTNIFFLVAQEHWNFKLCVAPLFSVYSNSLCQGTGASRGDFQASYSFSKTKNFETSTLMNLQQLKQQNKKPTDSHHLSTTEDCELSALINIVFSQASEKTVRASEGNKCTLQYYSHPSCFCFQTTESPSGRKKKAK